LPESGRQPFGKGKKDPALTATVIKNHPVPDKDGPKK